MAEILDDSRNELLDAYVAALMERTQASFVLLRGVMEGLFSVLYYREQSISLQLWSAGKSFEMLHSMLEPSHEFHKYFRYHFESERFKRDYPDLTCNSIFSEADALYKTLSSFVHKKSSAVRGRLNDGFLVVVERVFRIFLAFADRIEDLPQLSFPAPRSFCELESVRKKQQKPQKGSSRPQLRPQTPASQSFPTSTDSARMSAAKIDAVDQLDEESQNSAQASTSSRSSDEISLGQDNSSNSPEAIAPDPATADSNSESILQKE